MSTCLCSQTLILLQMLETTQLHQTRNSLQEKGAEKAAKEVDCFNKTLKF